MMGMSFDSVTCVPVRIWIGDFKLMLQRRYVRERRAMFVISCKNYCY